MRIYKASNWFNLLLPLARKIAHIEPHVFMDIRCRDQRAWRKFWKLAAEMGFTIGDFVYACLSTYQGLLGGAMIAEESIDPGAYWFPENTVEIVPIVNEVRL